MLGFGGLRNTVRNMSDACTGVSSKALVEAVGVDFALAVRFRLRLISGLRLGFEQSSFKYFAPCYLDI